MVLGPPPRVGDCKHRSTTFGSFAIYALNNHNVEITGTTLTSGMSWTSSGTTFVTRGLPPTAPTSGLSFRMSPQAPATRMTTGGSPRSTVQPRAPASTSMGSRAVR
jgi:hypothetical protein